MSIITGFLLIQYFSGNEGCRPRGGIVMNFVCAALGADPEADEGMFVVYYPLAKWGDH